MTRNIFFKQDHTGRRKPTAATWSLVCAFIFLSFYLSQNKEKRRVKPSKQDIIKEIELIEAANAPVKKEEKSIIDLSGVLDTQDRRESKYRPKLKEMIDSPMIVYDATSNYQSEQLIPLGSMVKCLLIHNIVTNNFSSPVIVQVWEDFYFDGKLLLPFGTRIYGTARAGRERDRVLVAFHTIVFQDGTEVKVKAISLSEDGSAGLTGMIVRKQNKKRILMMAMNFLSGVALGLQETATNAVTGLTEITTNSRNAVLEGVANTFEKQARSIEREIDAAEGYAIVLAGQELIVYFEKTTDVKPL